MFKKRNRRVGPADRRKHNQKPVEKKPGAGWTVGPELYYKRKDPVTGKVIYSKDQ